MAERFKLPVLSFIDTPGAYPGIDSEERGINEAIADLDGKLLPFGWAKLLWWLRKPRCRTMRVPLMGVLQKHQGGRLASQLAFMMIEKIRRNALAHFGATRGEIGWVLDDNQGMNAIADAIESTVNKEYTIYQKAL